MLDGFRAPLSPGHAADIGSIDPKLARDSAVHSAQQLHVAINPRDFACGFVHFHRQRIDASSRSDVVPEPVRIMSARDFTAVHRACGVIFLGSSDDNRLRDNSITGWDQGSRGNGGRTAGRPRGRELRRPDTMSCPLAWRPRPLWAVAREISRARQIMKLPNDGKRQAYRPGQIVPTSGIYTAVHELHRPRHEVVAIQGEEFPPCRLCKEEVRFYVATPVPHMMHDFDLTGPDTRVAKHCAKAAKKGSVG